MDALLAALGLAAWLGSLSVEQPSSCEALESELQGVWDAQRRGEVEARLLGSELGYVRQTAALVLPRIDDYAPGERPGLTPLDPVEHAVPARALRELLATVPLRAPTSHRSRAPRGDTGRSAERTMRKIPSKQADWTSPLPAWPRRPRPELTHCRHRSPQMRAAGRPCTPGPRRR